MGATIASIVANNPGRHFTFHVLAPGLSEDNRQRVERLGRMHPASVAVQVHLLDLSLFDEFAAILAHSHYSLSIFTRLLIPAVLQEQAERVLYLDADILCVGKVDELFEQDIGADIALVVPDVPRMAKRRVAALELPRAEYFNSGVMLINISKWIENGITAQARDTLLHSKKELRFPDQDALNIVLNGRARYISPRWNYLYDLIGDLGRNQRAMRPVGKAVFLHFAGAVKPWSEWSGHDARALFRRYHALSPWSDLALDQAPRNTKELRMQSRFLLRQGKPLQSLAWYLRYLRKRRAK